MSYVYFNKSPVEGAIDIAVLLGFGGFWVIAVLIGQLRRGPPREVTELGTLTSFKCVMSTRTALNSPPRGLVEEMAIPAEIHDRDGKRFASFGNVVPIHCCTPEQIEKLSATTHHYTDLFTDQVLAPLGELAYVRLDENTAEKVFINRSKRILLTSSDGRLAAWRAAPTFESTNCFIAGAPIVDKEGALVSLVTVRRGNHYAVTGFDGEGGYFDTPLPWKTVPAAGGCVYGDQVFKTRDALRDYVAALGPVEISPSSPATPVLLLSGPARAALVSRGGRQVAHLYLPGVLADNVHYL